MINGKKVLAIIPARAGSKRILNKNIRNLCEIPLIGWTLKDLHRSKYIDHSYVTTDSSVIQNIAIGFGVDAEPLRPVELASDTARTVDVVLDIINHRKKGYDIIILLQPTSPLRTIEDVDRALEFFVSRSALSLASVCEAESHPSWLSPLPEDLNMSKLIDGLQMKRSQDLTKHYRLNGAIYISTLDMIRQNESFFSPTNAYAFVMNRLASIDIDTEEDMLLAECLIGLKIKNGAGK